MPTTKQIDNNRSISDFYPVFGGSYLNGTLRTEDSHGFWWGSEASNGGYRYYLDYNSARLYTYPSSRLYGIYIRCVSEEKTVLDLTYMQDINLF